MNADELQKILAGHALWLEGKGGARADLHGADLRYASLDMADLRYASLDMADLRYANFRGADLRIAKLRRANLEGADLTRANLHRAHLGTHVVGDGQIVTWTSTYWAMSTRDTQGVRWLQYGCETLRLAEWRQCARNLAEKHEPKRAKHYEAETLALVALCEALDEEAQQ